MQAVRKQYSKFTLNHWSGAAQRERLYFLSVLPEPGNHCYFRCRWIWSSWTGEHLWFHIHTVWYNSSESTSLRCKCVWISTVYKHYRKTVQWHQICNIVHVQVKVKNDNVTFALKCIKKRHIVDNRQEEHVHSERRILSETRSPFIVKYVQVVCTYRVSCLLIYCANETCINQ